MKTHRIERKAVKKVADTSMSGLDEVILADTMISVPVERLLSRPELTSAAIAICEQQVKAPHPDLNCDAAIEYCRELNRYPVIWEE